MDININWEQRRYEIAKEAMNRILAASVAHGIKPDPICKDVVTLSVKFADTLIEELKGGNI